MMFRTAFSKTPFNQIEVETVNMDTISFAAYPPKASISFLHFKAIFWHSAIYLQKPVKTSPTPPLPKVESSFPTF